jgi:cytidylate kinase
VARQLGYRFVDTGLMYRAATWLALQRHVDLLDDDALGRLIENASLEVVLPASGEAGAGRVLVDGIDVTGDLRTTDVGAAVSVVSRVPSVREAMVDLQRRLASEGGIVMAGRDIGTVVLPDAPLKVYLDASPKERVRRRLEELRLAGRDVNEEQVREELALRDDIDSSRDVSPLRAAVDAVVINTDGLTLDQVVGRILELVRCR